MTATMDEVLALFIPIIALAGTAVVVALAIWLRGRARHDAHETLRAAIAQGQTLSPELVERFQVEFAPGRTDLRRGVLLLAAGIGTALFALALGEPDALRALGGIGALLAVLGLAFLGLSRLRTSR
jgi:hypothetical protein